MFRLALVLACAAVSAAPVVAADKPKKVLFVGIDGCRWDAVMYSQAKYLKELAKEGALSEQCDVLGDRKTGAVTATGPGWSSALTGVLADKHRVFDNGFKDHNLRDYPTFLARLKEAKPAAKVASFVTWAQFRDHILWGDQGCEYLIDGDKFGYEAGDRTVGFAAARSLSDLNLDAAFVYFGNADSAGHGYGFHPKSPKYTNAIEAIDEHLGRVLKAVRGRKTFAEEDWLILVCTDHGGKGRGHAPGDTEPEIRTGFLILH
ncbi:MAG: alkaline phosphatase family protein, partial [Gemmataceae bacterium]|nr:alkaline phosphatase family protein [Gemmataceae bacterium]